MSEGEKNVHLFSGKNQPTPEQKALGRARAKAARESNKRCTALLKALLDMKIDGESIFIQKIKQEIPHLLHDDNGKMRDQFTLEELMTFRMFREVMYNKNPLPYYREILDRVEGKATINVNRVENQVEIDHEERKRVKQDMLEKSRLEKEKRLQQNE